MRLRPLVLCAVFFTTALAVAGCSSGGTPATAAASSGAAAGAAGAVTVKAGGKVVCVITIKGGRGSCQVSTLDYAPGTVKFNASYSGGTGSKPSRPATASLQLLQAATKTSLSLSTATVTSGHEQAERLGVRVVPQFMGTPAGKITVRAGSTVVCVMTLVSGTGSCTLTANEFAAGSYPLVASYPGSTDFAGSASVKQTLAVTK
jgi:Bacterial Ig-like domain (group 3)